MARADLHGLLLVDKPSGITSHDVVARLRHTFKLKEIGHTGTLDPMASGLMVVLLGEATKISQYILTQNKSYEVSIRFGLITDSLDITGNTLQTFDKIPTAAEVKSAGETFVGTFELPVPKVSAVKVDGKKLLDYVHEGKEVPVVVKAMEFLKVKYLGTSEFGEPRFFVECSKGSFIRTWVNELGRKLGTGAAMSALRRVQSAPFDVEGSFTLQKIQEVSKDNPENLASILPLIPLEKALAEAPKVRVVNISEALIKNGQISYDLRRQLISAFKPGRDELVRVFGTDDQRLLAIVGVEANKGFVIRRVFKY